MSLDAGLTPLGLILFGRVPARAGLTPACALFGAAFAALLLRSASADPRRIR
jgi:hypothetical protein